MLKCVKNIKDATGGFNGTGEQVFMTYVSNVIDRTYFRCT